MGLVNLIRKIDPASENNILSKIPTMADGVMGIVLALGLSANFKLYQLNSEHPDKEALAIGGALVVSLPTIVYGTARLMNLDRNNGPPTGYTGTLPQQTLAYQPVASNYEMRM